MTQPVKMQKLVDESNLDEHRGNLSTPADPGSALMKEGIDADNIILKLAGQKVYQSRTAVCLHMMRWTRIGIQTCLGDYSRYMTEGRKSHMR